MSKRERRRLSYEWYAAHDPCSGHRQRKYRPWRVTAHPDSIVNRFYVGATWVFPLSSDGLFGQPYAVTAIDRERGIVTFSTD
jgi:hypothetical protein